ncbi:MAG: DUF2480 family protein [Leadbetterella sp.]|nr:DUF2480 family protein [Leadbetterella sp.]
MEDQIINKVALSGLITLDMEEHYPPGERVLYDIKDNLFMGLILKEKDFRAFLKEHDWAQYSGKNVAITCSEDAIVPMWAYMLLAVHLEPYARTVVFGTVEDLEKKLFDDILNSFDWEPYRDARVVVKGCSDKDIPPYVYVEITRRLRPLVKSLMFGEPCSTVPLYKQKPLNRA